VPNNVYGWGRIDALAAIDYPLDFQVSVAPETVPVCAPDTADFDIGLAQFLGFSEPVALTTSGLPPAATSGFAPNPVIPPGVSVLTIGGTASVAPGVYPFEIVGTSSPSGLVQSSPATLVVFDAIPTAPVPAIPVNGAVDVALMPTLAWGAVVQAELYRVEVATDFGFTSIVATAETAAAEVTLELPLEPTTEYFWRVAADNPCGDGGWSAVSSFTTRAIPPLLIVDDDDNSPDVRSTYTAALDAIGQLYDVWDTANSDAEPTAAELAPYRMVVWFTGDEFGGAAGPGSAGETALASWLDAGAACLLLSSQDYYYDRGMTSFMQSHLGLASATSDTGQTTVTGAGGVFGGHGPFTLSYPFTNYSDTVTAGAGAELVFSGDEGGAAVSRSTGTRYATFWGFPWEALPTAGDRETVMQAFLDACADASSLLFGDDFESGTTAAWSAVTP
jgi:hypothetical protein